MAMKPEPMQRTIIVSSRAHEKALIEALHGLHVAHLNAFTEDRAGEMAAFRIGRPLAEAGRASELLVKLRALIRNLDVEGHAPKRTFTVAEIEERLEAALFDAGQEITNAFESRQRMTQEIERLTEEEQRLAPLTNLPLQLQDYHGYDALKVFTGYVNEPVGNDLAGVVDQYSLFTGDDGFVALFVPAERAAAASDVLFQHGYREHPVPEGEGVVAERLQRITRDREELVQKLARAESTLAALRERHADFLAAAEEHLTIQVAKAEAPLSFASTENAFVVDAWVPVTEMRKLEAALDKATGGNVYVEKVPHAPHAMHGVDDIHGGSDEAHEGHDAAQPPTRLQNGGTVKPFQFFTEMFSVPKYDEIDPTTVLSIAFPLFFGFMIGDLGLGIVMALLGFLMFRKLGHIEGLKELGFAIAFAGVIAAIFGGFVFSDAFGIPLGVTHHMDELAEEAGLGHFECGPAYYAAAHETSWSCLLGMGEVHVEPVIAKTLDVQTMLLLSVAAALVHLLVGLLFGIKNEWGHSTKHTVAKFGWMVLLLTFFPAVIALLASDWLTATTGLAAGTAYMIAGGGFLVGLVVLGWSEGIAGVLEIPSMLSNILSYLRLGAVAIAKGSMAIAFNDMTLVSIGLVNGGAWIILGLILFVFVQAILFVLGVLSSGIQAIRLNYVEFFTKFYKGGGEKFTPFGHVRRYSVPSQAPSVGGGKL